MGFLLNEIYTGLHMTNDPRPPGKTTIAPEVLITITRLTALNIDGVSQLGDIPIGVNRLIKRTQSQGVQIKVENGIVDIDLFVILKPNTNIREVSRNIQHAVARAISEMVGMEPGMINIHIEDIDYESSN